MLWGEGLVRLTGAMVCPLPASGERSEVKRQEFSSASRTRRQNFEWFNFEPSSGGHGGGHRYDSTSSGLRFDRRSTPV